MVYTYFDEFYCRSRDTMCTDGTENDCKNCPLPVVFPKLTDSTVPFLSANMSDSPLAKKGAETFIKAVKNEYNS